MKRLEKAGLLLIQTVAAVDGDDELKPDYAPDVKHSSGGLSTDTPSQSSVGAHDGIAMVAADGSTKVVSGEDFLQFIAATLWNGVPFSSDAVFGGWWNLNPQPDAQGVYTLATAVQGIQSLNVAPQTGGVPWTVTLNGKTYKVAANQGFNPNWQNALVGPVTMTASISVSVNAYGRYVVPGAVPYKRTEAYQNVNSGPDNQSVADGQTVTIVPEQAGDLLQYLQLNGQGHWTFNGYDVDTTNSGSTQLGGDNIGVYPLPVTVKFVAASAGQSGSINGNIFRKL